MIEILGSLLRDARFSIRSYRKHLSFFGLAVSSLALGIGANIVVFTLFYPVVLEPLPYPSADRLLYVEETAPAWQIERMGFSYPDLVDFQERNRAFSHLAGFQYGTIPSRAKVSLRGSWVARFQRTSCRRSVYNRCLAEISALRKRERGRNP